MVGSGGLGSSGFLPNSNPNRAINAVTITAKCSGACHAVKANAPMVHMYAISVLIPISFNTSPPYLVILTATFTPRNHILASMWIKEVGISAPICCVWISLNPSARVVDTNTFAFTIPPMLIQNGSNQIILDLINLYHYPNQHQV